MKKIWKISLPIVFTMLFTGCVAIEEATPADTSDTSIDGATTEESATTEEGATQVETITIGALAPLSGDAAVYGVPFQRVAKIALDEINAAGGVDGKKLEIIWEDGGCNPNTANTATKKLLEIDKVHVIYGGFCSSETLAAAPLTEAAKAILFSPGSSSPDITVAGDFVFRNYPSDSTQGKVLADYAESKEWKKVGIFSEEKDYPKGIKETFEKEFSGETLTETFTEDSSDFRTQILKLKGAEVEAYFINPQTPAKADLLLKQLQEQGITGPFLLNDVATGFQENITKYATFIEGAVGAEASYDRSHPGVTALQTKYKELYKEDVPYMTYMTTVYDAVYIIEEALEKVNGDSTNTEGMRDFFYGIKGRKGLAGSLTIDQNGDPLSGHLLRIVKNGVVEDLK